MLKGLADLPTDLGRVVVNQLGEEWGGQHVYVPMDKQRPDGIYEMFTGNNHHDLARRFKMSVPAICQDHRPGEGTAARTAVAPADVELTGPCQTV